MVSSLEMEKLCDHVCVHVCERVRIWIKKKEVLGCLGGLGVYVLVITSGCVAFTPSGLPLQAGEIKDGTS